MRRLRCSAVARCPRRRRDRDRSQRRGRPTRQSVTVDGACSRRRTSLKVSTSVLQFVVTSPATRSARVEVEFSAACAHPRRRGSDADRSSRCGRSTDRGARLTSSCTGAGPRRRRRGDARRSDRRHAGRGRWTGSGLPYRAPDLRAPRLAAGTYTRACPLRPQPPPSAAHARLARLRSSGSRRFANHPQLLATDLAEPSTAAARAAAARADSGPIADPIRPLADPAPGGLTDVGGDIRGRARSRTMRRARIGSLRRRSGSAKLVEPTAIAGRARRRAPAASARQMPAASRAARCAGSGVRCRRGRRRGTRGGRAAATAAARRLAGRGGGRGPILAAGTPSASPDASGRRPGNRDRRSADCASARRELRPPR